MIRFRFVQDNRADLPVNKMCELVEVPRSSFYAWANDTPWARELADQELLETIRDIYRRSRNTYGVPRVYGQLRRTGHRVARPSGLWRSVPARCPRPCTTRTAPTSSRCTAPSRSPDGETLRDDYPGLD